MSTTREELILKFQDRVNQTLPELIDFLESVSNDDSVPEKKREEARKKLAELREKI